MEKRACSPMEVYRLLRAMASAGEAAGDAAGAPWWVLLRVPPLAMSAQVGAVRERVEGWGKFECFCGPASRLDLSATLEGEVGGLALGDVT
jgi:hypothetical protein